MAEYTDFIAGQAIDDSYRRHKLRAYRSFLTRWPELPEWFAAPLVERIGRLRGDPPRRGSFSLSYRARPYLVFLGLHGYATFDYPWLLAASQVNLGRAAAAAGVDLGINSLVTEAVELGFGRGSASQAMPRPISLRHWRPFAPSASGRIWPASMARQPTTGWGRPRVGSRICTSSRSCSSIAGRSLRNLGNSCQPTRRRTSSQFVCRRFLPGGSPPAA